MRLFSIYIGNVALAVFALLLSACGYTVSTTGYDSEITGTYSFDFSRTSLNGDSLNELAKHSTWNFSADHTYQVNKNVAVSPPFGSGTWEVFVNEDWRYIQLKTFDGRTAQVFMTEQSGVLYVHHVVFDLPLNTNKDVVVLNKINRSTE